LALWGLVTATSQGAEAQTVRQAPAELPPPPAELPPPPAEKPPTSYGFSTAEETREGFNPIGDQETLALADVVASLYRAYPQILATRRESQVAAGDLLAAYGSYDTKLEGYTLSEPTGFYENYRHGIGVARQTWWGGYVSAGYRIGRGDFQPWYKERETEKGGELKLGFSLPLLQGRAIDPQRVAVFQASLARRAVEPKIQQAILETAADAATAYWAWVAAGGILEAQRELLNLAETRGEQYEAGVEAGKFAEIDLLLNEQLIAERRGKLLETEQKYRATAFKLSLFLRDETGQPMVPQDAWLPHRFPVIEPLPASEFRDDLQQALRRRPEPRLLQIERRQVELERQLATNNRLPRFDLVAEASQDVGRPASSSDDKGEMRLIVGLESQLPIQRRKARGKQRATAAKIAQLNDKLRLQRDKIGTELLAAHNALRLSAQIVDQTEASLRAAIETLERYRFAFERGKIDLIYLNLLETKVNETEIKLVEAQQSWFASLVQMQVALGLDPLDQALLIAKLPPSERPGPGNLPPTGPLEENALERDWQLHSRDEMPAARPAEPDTP
jgi:outer membrane protein TolC